MKIAKSNNDMASVFGFAGGFLVGWPLGTLIAGGEPNWVLAGVGAGLIGISIPLSSSYAKHARNAVEIYNGGLRNETLSGIDFSLGFGSYGVGLKMLF